MLGQIVQKIKSNIVVAIAVMLLLPILAHTGITIIQGGNTEQIINPSASGEHVLSTGGAKLGFKIGSVKWLWPTADGTANQVLKTDASGNLAFASVTTLGGAPDNATYITQTVNATLTAEQALNSLTVNRLLRNTTGGVLAASLWEDDGANAKLVSGQMILPNGTAAVPSLIGADGNSGLWFSESGLSITYTRNGVSQFRLDGNITLGTSGEVLWMSATDIDGASVFLRLGMEAEAILQQGADSATPIAQIRKGPDGSGTDILGGKMSYSASRSTGNAVPSIVALLGGAATVTSGTTQQTLVDRLIPNAFKVLTNNSAIAVVNATIANGSVVGGLINYTIEVTDGTDFQVESGQAVYSSQNKAGVVAGTITEVNSQQNLSAGTLTTTWAISNANPAVVSVNANSSLTPSTGYPRVTFSIQNFGQQGIAIQ
jgi:hypothetical protein